MPLPADPISHVRRLHSEFEARTGYAIRWNLHRENQWSAWCRWADWDWAERELAMVIFYLRGKISKGERNEGALKFDNLIGQPDKFEEDLNLALEARKGAPTFRPKAPAPAKPAGTASDGQALFSGREAAASFAEMLKNQK